MSHITLKACLIFESGVRRDITVHYPYRVVNLDRDYVQRTLTDDFKSYARACDDTLSTWKFTTPDAWDRIADASALRLSL